MLLRIVIVEVWLLLVRNRNVMAAQSLKIIAARGDAENGEGGGGWNELLVLDILRSWATPSELLAGLKANRLPSGVHASRDCGASSPYKYIPPALGPGALPSMRSPNLSGSASERLLSSLAEGFLPNFHTGYPHRGHGIERFPSSFPPSSIFFLRCQKTLASSRAGTKRSGCDSVVRRGRPVVAPAVPGKTWVPAE